MSFSANEVSCIREKTLASVNIRQYNYFFVLFGDFISETIVLSTDRERNNRRQSDVQYDGH